MDLKLEKDRFSAQVDKDDTPVARGSFGKVFRNSLTITDVSFLSLFELIAWSTWPFIFERRFRLRK